MTRTIETPDGVVLAVTETGDPAAPALAVAPGVGSRAAFAVACFAGAAARAGLRLVTYDPRGHGASTPLPDPARHALSWHAADLAAVARATGAVRAGGISLGGYAALAAAAGGLAVDSVHVALPAPLGPGTVTALANAAAADEIERYGVPAAVARLRADTGTLPWVAEEVAASWLGHRPDSLVAALRAVAAEPAFAATALVRVPVVVAAVTDDPAHPYDAAASLAAALPDATVRTTSLAALAADRGLLGATALTGPR